MAEQIFRAGLLRGEPVAAWHRRTVADGPLKLGSGDDLFLGRDGVDDWIYGQGGDDQIAGNGGNDILRGGAGDDFLSGGKNRDRLFGGDGNDGISGGGGNDVIVGGAGTDSIDLGSLLEGNSDRVVFKEVSDSLPGDVHDTVGQFVSGEDHIDLRKIDADALTPGDDAFTWISRAAFGGVAGELRYEQSTQLLQGDVDGDGLADFEVLFRSGVRVVVAEADIIL